MEGPKGEGFGDLIRRIEEDAGFQQIPRSQVEEAIERLNTEWESMIISKDGKEPIISGRSLTSGGEWGPLRNKFLFERDFAAGDLADQINNDPEAKIIRFALIEILVNESLLPFLKSKIEENEIQYKTEFLQKIENERESLLRKICEKIPFYTVDETRCFLSATEDVISQIYTEWTESVDEGNQGEKIKTFYDVYDEYNRKYIRRSKNLLHIGISQTKAFFWKHIELDTETAPQLVRAANANIESLNRGSVVVGSPIKKFNPEYVDERGVNVEKVLDEIRDRDLGKMKAEPTVGCPGRSMIYYLCNLYQKFLTEAGEIKRPYNTLP